MGIGDELRDESKKRGDREHSLEKLIAALGKHRAQAKEEQLPLFQLPETSNTVDLYKALLVGIGATWLTYEPVTNLLNLKSPGPSDESISMLVGLLAGAMYGIDSRIFTACAYNTKYKTRRRLGGASGGLKGFGVGGMLMGIGIAADIIATGGFLAASAVLLGGGAASGYAIGDHVAKIKATKLCGGTPDHKGKCCERICLECGFIFAPELEWANIKKISDVDGILKPRLSWYDVVSILNYQGVNYPNACLLLEENWTEWRDDKTRGKSSGELVISTDRFFDWLKKNREKLIPVSGKNPDTKLWARLEPLVRSDCDTDTVIACQFPQRKKGKAKFRISATSGNRGL